MEEGDGREDCLGGNEGHDAGLGFAIFLKVDMSGMVVLWYYLDVWVVRRFRLSSDQDRTERPPTKLGE